MPGPHKGVSTQHTNQQVLVKPLQKEISSQEKS